jgi:hypothetical protein
MANAQLAAVRVRGGVRGEKNRESLSVYCKQPWLAVKVATVFRRRLKNAEHRITHPTYVSVRKISAPLASSESTRETQTVTSVCCFNPSKIALRGSLLSLSCATDDEPSKIPSATQAVLSMRRYRLSNPQFATRADVSYSRLLRASSSSRLDRAPEHHETRSSPRSMETSDRSTTTFPDSIPANHDTPRQTAKCAKNVCM